MGKKGEKGGKRKTSGALSIDRRKHGSYPLGMGKNGGSVLRGGRR